MGSLLTVSGEESSTILVRERFEPGVAVFPAARLRGVALVGVPLGVAAAPFPAFAIFLIFVRRSLMARAVGISCPSFLAYKRSWLAERIDERGVMECIRHAFMTLL